MKKLRGSLKGMTTEAFEGNEIVLKLEHDREITIRRTKNGIELFCDIARTKTANARFVMRAQNFGMLELCVEQCK